MKQGTDADAEQIADRLIWEARQRSAAGRAESSPQEQAAGGGWVKLREANGFLQVDEAKTYLFAIKLSVNGAPAEWGYFSDAVVWDAETDPEWSDGAHGWDLDGDIWFRPLPSPPPDSGKGGE